MAKWMYPLAKRARFFFVLKGGKRKKVSLDNYRELVQTGKLAEDAWWYIYQNYDHIEPGDEIYIYTGDRDAGIIGYATVEKKRDNRGWKEIGVKVDLDRCRMLIEQPVPAPIVHHWIPFPRACVISLERFQTELSRCLPWNKNFYLKATITKFKELNLRPRSKTRISPRDYQRKFVHDTLLEPAVDLLKANGFKVGAKSFGKLQLDLVGMRNSHLIIVEGKTNKQGFARKEAREAFGQLYEYRWHFKRTGAKNFKYILWVIFQSRPETEVIEFLEDHKFLVGWVQNRRILFANRSKKQFQQLVK